MRRVFSVVCGLALLWVVICGPVSLCVAQSKDAFREARLKMVQEEIAREGVKNKAVLDSMRSVPRHLFVSAEHRPDAYFDQALPIGSQQTISPPFIVAYMTETLDPKPDDKVLEIGTGSGYQAAVLSGIVREVYTIEIVKELGEAAAIRLKDLKYNNVSVKVGDGYLGWAEHAPYDKIIVTCSPEKIPQPLVDQLKDGGRMIIPLGERYDQVFYLVEKRGTELTKKQLLPALFVPMTGTSEEQRNIKPDPLRPALRNGGFEEDANGDGLPNAWYYQRQAKLDSRDAPEGKKFITFENRSSGRGSQLLQGLAIDGEKIGSLEFQFMIKGQSIKPGSQTWEQAGIIVHYFDSQRHPLGNESIGPWRGTFAWRRGLEAVSVPAAAREAIIRIGLNGGTGVFSIDNLRLSAVPR